MVFLFFSSHNEELLTFLLTKRRKRAASVKTQIAFTSLYLKNEQNDPSLLMQMWEDCFAHV